LRTNNAGAARYQLTRYRETPEQGFLNGSSVAGPRFVPDEMFQTQVPFTFVQVRFSLRSKMKSKNNTGFRFICEKQVPFTSLRVGFRFAQDDIKKTNAGPSASTHK
jgi:hypothetical protein